MTATTRPNRHLISRRRNRFAVFRAVQAWMEAHRECPTAADVAAVTGLAAPTVLAHMRALDGADGLPLPITTIREGLQRRLADTGRKGIPASDAGRYSYHAPVDRVFDSGDAGRLMGYATAD